MLAHSYETSDTSIQATHLNLALCFFAYLCRLTGVTAPKQRLPMLDKILADTRSTLDEVMDFMLNK